MESFCRIVPEDDGEGDKTYPEPRKIDVFYNSLFAKDHYLQPKVMLEIGARALFEPTVQTRIQSLIAGQFPNIETNVVAPYEITTASPQKTFLEKAFLLHELFTTDRANNAERKSRHLYDLEKMMDMPFAQKAIVNDILWNTIAHHREIFTSISGMDYSADIRDRIVLCPPQKLNATWEKDYRDMQLSMIYGDSPPIERLIERIKKLEDMFHNRLGIV